MQHYRSAIVRRNSTGGFTLSLAIVFSFGWGCSTDGANEPAGGGAAHTGTGATSGGDATGGSESNSGSGGAVSSSGGSGVNDDYSVPKNVWPSDECVDRVSALLASMTLQQKAAQMVMAQNTQISPAGVASGLVTNIFAGGNEGPPDGLAASNWATYTDGFFAQTPSAPHQLPLLFGLDAVHGHNRAIGAVIFPHNIGLGATRNPELVEEIGRITALEMAATGINWTFGPMLSVSHDDRWGRVYESYSEDPDDVALLGSAAVAGLQGRAGLGSGSGVVACAKHFAGDGQGTFGTSARAGDGGTVDRSDVQIDEATMRRLGIDPYIPAIETGLGCVMASDTTWNGVNMTRHEHLLTTILKEELGFQGIIVTDWNAADIAGVGLLNAVNAGVDMFMEPYAGWENKVSSIANAVPSLVSEERVTDAARRILTVKCEAGLFEWSRDQSLLPQVGSEKHRAVARKAVRESLVLLQHENSVLPLSKGSHVYVAGSGANTLVRQAGGWTINWQGGAADSTSGTTVRAAVSQVATVVDDLSNADVALIVLSENAYAEFLGDVSSIDTLPSSDFEHLSQAKAAGKPVVALIFSGRPVLLSSENLALADAWIAAWLPGTEGAGIVDVIFGDHNFVGKLSHSWPRTEAQANQNKGDVAFDPLFPYGHGLTY
jgi:beta-glucosidase